ncbi:DUF3107 family protein [Gordonia pseudamarae]|jgi:hypothetical protein|uniref:DUF3107 family protein n=1 Tax=Gordonia pseudamarae TaxID=2831662 RepID=A0ABX6IK24_9ACTN|nr:MULTISPECIES: DUF3107 domain-containing protein [Gordonia]MBD0022722.1 DUF3107 domain-containing protein [Gordonia sp. (in: high G+C Gram-positive bacteria)]QHN27331.1 DUF3107 family protein [Gordonia pseudamarae]QHN36214.1 DUF3107 family protein [Gordonia pseudamarae]
MAVEVKIGIVDSPRELAVQTALSSDEAYAAVRAVLAGDSASLELTDDKGSRVLVPAARIAYVEVGAAEARKVGFGS